MKPPETATGPRRPLGLTVVLIAGVLMVAIGGLILILSPLFGTWPEPNSRLLSAAIGGLAWVMLLCAGLWRNAGWTWWLLAIPAYVLAALGVLFALNEPDWTYRLRNGLRALICLVAAVWYFQFKPSVVSYYAAIKTLQTHLAKGSRHDAA